MVLHAAYRKPMGNNEKLMIVILKLLQSAIIIGRKKNGYDFFEMILPFMPFVSTCLYCKRSSHDKGYFHYVKEKQF